ncbi:hypothetical protein [Leifsonia sp. NPDC058230]|uniref:hypothetical protein n=1 Tax=Leifsonia sp. NPDC058230 TaxID=3346391 RepID=UPI0036DB4E3F
MRTPEEVKQEVEELYEATRDAVLGDWDIGGWTWTGCATSAGSEGGAFNIFSQRREQLLPSDPESVAKAVRAILADQGHSVTVEYIADLPKPRWVLSDPPWLAGSGPEGLLVQFTVADGYADFSATSRCVAGDLGKLSGIE